VTACSNSAPASELSFPLRLDRPKLTVGTHDRTQAEQHVLVSPCCPFSIVAHGPSIYTAECALTGLLRLQQ
jgi:hypothetical protein